MQMPIRDWKKRYIVDSSFRFFPGLQIIEGCRFSLKV